MGDAAGQPHADAGVVGALEEQRKRAAEGSARACFRLHDGCVAGGHPAHSLIEGLEEGVAHDVPSADLESDGLVGLLLPE